MKSIFTYLLLFFSISSFGQFEEHFTDGGFNANPHWDTLAPLQFRVFNKVLFTTGNSGGGKAGLVTVDTVGPSAEWSIYIRLGFEPTDSDNVKIVLVSDQFDIRGDFSGYFVRIGQNGTNDGLDFYRKDGVAEVLIKSMDTAHFATGADGNLKVIKNNLGKWVFYWKDTTQPDYVAVDSTNEHTHTTAAYFGMLCTYTDASKDSFAFDDVYSIRMPLLSEDTMPPFVDSVALINSQQIDVYFSEKVDATTAQAILNYSLSTIGNPISVVIDANNNRLAHLYFSSKLLSNTAYTLTTQNVQDSIGNAMVSASDNLLQTPYFAGAGDVLVSEIMIKPTGSLLPNKQYIEFKNKTAEVIRLKDFSVNNQLLQDGYLQPNGYVIVCNANDTTTFKLIANTVGIVGFNALQNDGAISIRSNDNTLIDTLDYKDDFYQDATKQLGGWSMELNESGYSSGCSYELSWSASNDSKGGTPGNLNTNGFPVNQVHATDSLLSLNKIEIKFNAPMDSNEVLNIANYIWDNGITVQSVSISNIRNTTATITLLTQLDSNIIYHLKIPLFSGCAGYVHLADTFEYAITREPNSGELILNEILFQPNSSVSQFVEIYNKSSNLFKVKDLMLTQEDIITGNETSTTDISTAKGYIFPNDYLVFSKDKNSVKTAYEDAVLLKFIDLTIPTLDTKEDIVLLKNKSNVVLDKLHYNRDWHFPLLRTTVGVSLEKTAFDLPTQVKRYWHSAAEVVGLATPGYLNSEDSYELLGDVHIIPEVFSPDGDGVDDVATITYNFDDDGSVVNAYLYNTEGRLVNHLVHNENIPKEGVFIWNGNNENDNKNDIGIYFLVFERIKADGKKLVYKRKCVLAGKLN